MRALRTIAIAIAVAAFIDPPLTTTVRARPRISVVDPSGSRVADRFRGDYDIIPGIDPTTAATIVVDHHYPSIDIGADQRVSTVTLPDRDPVRVRLAAPRAVPPATAIRVEADVDADAMRGRETVLVARTHDVEVARATHTWSRDRERWHVAMDVVPLGRPPFVIDVNDRSVVVDQAPPLTVMFFEPRPSWPTTFVRRAIERDARFSVQTVTALRDIDADILVAGGLDRVSDHDVETMDRFARERGGAIVLLPDARVGGSARRLLADVETRETLLDAPTTLAATVALPRLDASELLTATDTLPAAATVLARATRSSWPVIWTAPHGTGTILVSGALDAWRYRAEANVQFDRFWRAAFAALALDVPPPVDVSVRGRHVDVRIRDPFASTADLSVSAALRSGDPVRLWPDSEVGTYSGTIATRLRSTPDRIVVTATGGGQSIRGAAPVIATTDDKDDDERLPLSLLATSHGGVNVSSGDPRELDGWLRTVAQAPNVQTVIHPMRSIWWIVPFVAALSGEWWTRRRRGLR